MKKFSFLFLIAIVSVFASCNKETIVDKSNEDFSLKNGMLFFKNSSTFFKTIELLDNMTNNQLESWLVENNFDNSLYFKMKEMNECGEYQREGVALTPDDIHDKSFTALLSDEGIVSVGDTISYVTKNVEYVITNGDFSMIDKIKENSDKEYENVIKQYPHSNQKAAYASEKSVEYKRINGNDII